MERPGNTMKKIRQSKNKKNLSRNKLIAKPNIAWPMIIGIIVILFSLKLIYSNLTNVSFNPGTSINQVGVAEGRVNLTLSPANIVTTANTEQTLTLSIDAGVDYATLAQIELNYDPAKIGTPVVTQGDFLTSSIGTTKVQNGKITFTYITALPENGEQAGKKGTGTLATIKFTPQADGESSISFADSSLVIITDATTLTSISSNMLKSANSVNIKVGNVTNSVASPSPTTTTVSPSPTTSPSIAPSLEPSPSPTSQPVKPNKPSNLLYNCYDNGTKITLRWDAVSGVNSYEVYLDHKDGDRDQRETVSGREKDFNITANTKYNWSLTSIKDGVKSDASTINDLSCNGSSNSTNSGSTTANTNSNKSSAPTPAPIATKKPSLISSIKKTLTPTKTASPKPTATPATKPTTTTTPIVITTPTPTPGSLADIYKNVPSPTPTTQMEKPSMLAQIFLGWKAIFLRIINLFVN